MPADSRRRNPRVGADPHRGGDHAAPCGRVVTELRMRRVLAQRLGLRRDAHVIAGLEYPHERADLAAIWRRRDAAPLPLKASAARTVEDVRG